MDLTFLLCLLSSEKIKDKPEPEPPVIVTMGDKLGNFCLKPVWEVRQALLPICFFGSGWLSSNSKTCGVLVPLCRCPVGISFQSTRSCGWVPAVPIFVLEGFVGFS